MIWLKIVYEMLTREFKNFPEETKWTLATAKTV
jgi:hypothetical protein